MGKAGEKGGNKKKYRFRNEKQNKLKMSSRDSYICGYGSTSSGLPLEKLREQSSTFENYVSGTVGVVFFIFLVFILIQIMTLILMGYSRYMKKREPKPGFY